VSRVIAIANQKGGALFARGRAVWGLDLAPSSLDLAGAAMNLDSSGAKRRDAAGPFAVTPARIRRQWLRMRLA
jgi:hypothetical protein